MGRSLHTPALGLSVPALSRAMGYTHPRIYQLLRAGKGPKLTPITLSPTSAANGRREAYVEWSDAFAWIAQRSVSAPTPKERARASQALHALKVKWIAEAVKSGHVPKLPWVAQEPTLTPHHSGADDSWLPRTERTTHIAVSTT